MQNSPSLLLPEASATSKKKERNSGSLLERLTTTVESIESSTIKAQPSNETSQQARMAIAIAEGNPIHFQQAIYDRGEEVEEHNLTIKRITKLEAALTENSETIKTLETDI